MKLNTSHIPELSFLDSWIQENQLSYQAIQDMYQSLIDMILNISQESIGIIRSSRENMGQRNISLHSASSLNTADFLEYLKKQGKINGLECAFDFDSKDSHKALLCLQNMLESGSKIAQDTTQKPQDGDKIWDRVIWGHTQANSNVSSETMIHFILSHYLCQYANLVLGANYQLQDKDDFINVLADLILLTQAQGLGNDDMYQAWSQSKQNGGLGWIDEKQLEVYKNS